MKTHVLIPFLVGVLTWGCAGKPESPMPSPAPPPQTHTLPALEITAETFIEIQIEGGGVFGGASPATGNRTVIGTDGAVVVETGRSISGRRERTYNVSRSEVERLAGFIDDQGFFLYQEIYDCSSSDPDCRYAKKKFPRPAPLSLDVAIGERRALVEVTVFDRDIVDYPTGLQAVVDSITHLVERAKAAGR